MSNGLIDSVIKKVTELEKKEVKLTIPDYSAFFEALQKVLEQWQIDYNTGQAEVKSVRFKNEAVDHVRDYCCWSQQFLRGLPLNNAKYRMI